MSFFNMSNKMLLSRMNDSIHFLYEKVQLFSLFLGFSRAPSGYTGYFNFNFAKSLLVCMLIYMG